MDTGRRLKVAKLSEGFTYRPYLPGRYVSERPLWRGCRVESQGGAACAQGRC